MASGDGKPHIATVDRVGTSTEHVSAISSRRVCLRLLGLQEQQAVFQTDAREGYRRVTRPHVCCAVTDYPGTGKDGPHSPSAKPSEQVAASRPRASMRS